MNIVTKNIICKNETLTLTNHRAVYWPKQEMLIISDLHVGKAAHFRKSGIPVSTEVLNNDLERLKQLLSFFKAKQLMVVGDLFHAGINNEFKIFRNWLDTVEKINLILVKGNHDKISSEISDLFFDWNIFTTHHISPFNFIHESLNSIDNVFQISGHTHPGVLLKGKGKQRIKLPCYQISKNQLILPAFSLFTGLNTKPPLEKVINYAFTEDHIFELI